MRYALTICLALGGWGSANAASLDTKVISGDAKWWLHVDADGLHKSPVFKSVREKMLEREQVKHRLARLKDKFDFDPATDLHSVTAYGTTLEPHRGVLVIKADVDQPVVIKQLKDRRGYETSTYNDHELHSIRMHGRHGPPPFGPPHHGGYGRGGDRDRDGDRDANRQRDGRGDRDRDSDRGRGRDRDSRADGDRGSRGDRDRDQARGRDRDSRGDRDRDSRGDRPRGEGGPRPPHEPRLTISFAKDNLAVIGHSTDSVKAALDVLDGKTASLSQPTDKAPDDAIVQANVSGISEIKAPFKSPLLTQSDRMSVWISDVDGKVRAHKQAVMKSAEVAGQIQAIVEGFRAMGQLRTTSKSDIKPVFDNIKVDTKGETVSVDWELSDEQVLKALAAVHEMRKHWRDDWRHGPGHGHGPPPGGPRADRQRGEDRGPGDRDRSERRRPDRERSDRDRSNRDRSDRDRSDRDRREQRNADRPEAEAGDSNESK